MLSTVSAKIQRSVTAIFFSLAKAFLSSDALMAAISVLRRRIALMVATWVTPIIVMRIAPNELPTARLTSLVPNWMQEKTITHESHAITEMARVFFLLTVER